MYPAAFGTTRVKIFCQFRNNYSPKAFVTLTVPNIGESPDLSNPICIGEKVSDCPDFVGKITFQKIGVDLAVCLRYNVAERLDDFIK